MLSTVVSVMDTDTLKIPSNMDNRAILHGALKVRGEIVLKREIEKYALSVKNLR